MLCYDQVRPLGHDAYGDSRGGSDVSAGTNNLPERSVSNGEKYHDENFITCSILPHRL